MTRRQIEAAGRRFARAHIAAAAEAIAAGDDTILERLSAPLPGIPRRHQAAVRQAMLRAFGQELATLAAGD